MNYTYYRRYRPPRRRKKNSFQPFFWLVLVLVILALILKGCVGAISKWSQEKRDDLVLSVDRGSAEVLVAGQASDAAPSQLMFEGDAVRTAADSYVTLSFKNDSRLILDENTHLTFKEANLDNRDDYFTFELHDGRVWVDHLAKDDGDLHLIFQTDVIDVATGVGQSLVSNLIDDEYIYVFEGSAELAFVDRGQEDVVVEALTLSEGNKSVLSDLRERNLLARENVVLSEQIEEDEFLEDDFVLWNRGDFVFEPEEEEVEELEEESELEEPEELEEEESVEEVTEEPVEEAEEVLEEEPVVEDESLAIAVTFPSTPITLSEATAIEGSIVNGTASRVIITWSGNGAPYQLGLFETGDSTFRYVADPNYANMNEGLNTYTVVAYDSEGQPSNSVVLEITLDSTAVVEENL